MRTATPTETFVQPTLEPLVVPDLSLTKAFTSTCAAGHTTSFRLSVRNVGDGATSGPIDVVDPMPTGMTLVLPVTAAAWDCSGSTSTLLHCTYAAVLQPNTAPLEVNAHAQVASGVGKGLLNTATGSTPGDLNPINDSDSALCVEPAPAPALDPLGLAIGVAALIGAAAFAMRRRSI